MRDTSFDRDAYSFEGFAKRVQERFESRADVMAAIGGDHMLNPGSKPGLVQRSFRDAAVLIAAFERDGDAHILLTQRTDHLNSHSGQVAFPGGKIDDGESAQQAALREAHEEVGLDPGSVEILGTFGTYYSGSGYSIAPVVGLVSGSPELNVNEDEVAAAFEVPLRWLMDQNRHTVESRMWQDVERFFYVMPYLDEAVAPPVERRIWGVTAGMIRMMQERLYGG
ncbi:MAG: CoA pyrophosphatase [Ahrensia sp.]|nr:CoA pyrophosphatase [Ahrensia sp.]